MSKYEPLWEHLKMTPGMNVQLGYLDIEKVLYELAVQK